MRMMTPADYVIGKFGGVRATGRAIGRSPGAVSQWRAPLEKRGRGGHVPRAAMTKILIKAHELQLDITPSDLLYGRLVKDSDG